MQVIFRILTSVVVFLMNGLCYAEVFVYEGADPEFKVTIPNIPPLKMDVHPKHSEQSHLRYMGSSPPYAVSILMPTADQGMTPRECASAIFGQLLRRPGVPSKDKVQMSRINDDTYVAIYASPMTGVVMLHAHFVSAAKGTHCIEVHVSKASTSPEDAEPWFTGFGAANFERK